MSNMTTSTAVIISNEMLRPTGDKKAEESRQATSFAEILSNATNKTVETPYVRSAKATELRAWIMDESTKYPDKAEMWAHICAHHSFDEPLLDMSSCPAMRLSASGEIYTAKMRNYYDQVRQEKQGGLKQLYESEKDKGSSSQEILKKIFAYNDALPNEFKRIGDW